MGRSASSAEIIAKLKAAGWLLKAVKGSHHHFVNPARPGKVTVPHPAKDLSIGVLKSLERATGLKLR